MAIMSAIVWYVLPGLLGRTYDMKNESVGPDIFNHADLDKARKIERYMTISEYRVVSEFSEASDFLDVSGKLALKLKTGAVNVEGKGNYLKESTSFQNTVDLLVKVHYETVIFTLPANIKPIPNWYSMIEGTGNTHYIRSITYGGDLIASVRFQTSNEADKEIIKGEIQGELNSDSGSFGGGLKGSLEKIQKQISETASMDINYYATVPLENIPRTIDGLTSLVDKFPEQTKKVNNGYGVPLSMEIFSLEGLQKDLPTYYQTQALIDQMTMLDEQFSDIRNTKKRLADWLKTVPPVLNDTENQKIGQFKTKLDNIDKVFSDVIANLNLSSEASSTQFKPAFDAYQGDNPESFPSMYVRELSHLKKDVLDNTPSIEVDFGGPHYNYWGSDECPEAAKSIYAGLMATTNQESIGSSQFLCLPNDRQYFEEQINNDGDIEDLPQIQPAAFTSRKKGVQAKRQYVKCASCRVPGKTTATMLSGKTECPENWVKQYQGILVSTDYQSVRGELVCLDTTQSLDDVPSEQDDLTVVTEVSAKCGNFPCSGAISGEKSIPCVVCSVTKLSFSKADILKL